MSRPLIALTMGYRQEGTMYRIRTAYVSALESAGGLVVALPHTEVAASTPGRILDAVQGLVLAGGTDIDPIWYGEEPRAPHKMIDPIRDAFEIALCREAMDRDMPVLAICRGIQVLNVAAGGTLHQDVSDQRGSILRHVQDAPRWHPTHTVSVRPHTRLAEILDLEECRVNSFHHQTLRDIAPGFTKCASASDGTIEAIENPTARFAIGVQWHPEDLAQRLELWRGFFKHFVWVCETSDR